MDFVRTRNEIWENAWALADAIQDGADQPRAKDLIGRGRVYLPFRYGEQLAFAPAKFIGFRANSITGYDETRSDRYGGEGRKAVSRVLGSDAVESAQLELQLANYCLQAGIDLKNYKHSFWIEGWVSRCVNNDRSAIRDLDAGDVRNDDPEYRRRICGTYVRDQAVRNAALARAKGRCEFCGKEGFATASGQRFLEAHHVISLSEQGPDRLTNVIALCPNDHRRAHFGKDWKELQDQFLQLLNRAR